MLNLPLIFFFLRTESCIHVPALDDFKMLQSIILCNISFALVLLPFSRKINVPQIKKQMKNTVK